MSAHLDVEAASFLRLLLALALQPLNGLVCRLCINPKLLQLILQVYNETCLERAVRRSMRVCMSVSVVAASNGRGRNIKSKPFADLLQDTATMQDPAQTLREGKWQKCYRPAASMCARAYCCQLCSHT